MPETQYPELTEEELHELLHGSFAQENKRRTDATMIYLHDAFLREFYSEFPRFYTYIFESGENYLLEDLGDGELRAIPSPIMGTLLRYIEILIKNQDIDEAKDILSYLEQGYQSEDPQVKDLIIGFVNDIYIVPDVLHALVKLLPPGMHKHFMEYNSDLL